MPIQICCFSGDYALVDNYSGYQFWVHKSVVIDGYVYGLGDIAYDGGSTDIVQIFSEQFWCKETYMLDVPTETTSTITNTVGQTKKLNTKCNIYSSSNLTGTAYTYKANTTVTILKNISATVDKVKVNATGRVGYISNSNYN